MTSEAVGWWSERRDDTHARTHARVVLFSRWRVLRRCRGVPWEGEEGRGGEGTSKVFAGKRSPSAQVPTKRPDPTRCNIRSKSKFRPGPSASPASSHSWDPSLHRSAESKFRSAAGSGARFRTLVNPGLDRNRGVRRKPSRNPGGQPGSLRLVEERRWHYS